MYIVRKKYIIKITAFAVFFLAIIAGIFIFERRLVDETEKNKQTAEIALLTNVCAGVQSITNSFEKALNLGSFESENKEIYAQSHTIKNMLCYYSSNTLNTAKWFSELCNYAKTDMSNSEKNTVIHTKLSQARSLLINICSDYNSKDSIEKLEKLFEEKEDQSYYEKQLEELENQYPLLTNQITADRKEIADFAKKLLEFPLPPKLFYGNYKAPKAVSYSHSASYAEIFPSGNMLNRMALQTTPKITEVSDLSIHDAAKHYLTIYAPYAQNCAQIFSQKTNKTMYFIFSPIINKENFEITNYNERIMLALNISDNSLKAFDASQYLKNHNVDFYNDIHPLSFGEFPSELKDHTIISEKNALLDRTSFIEYCFSPDDISKYYFLLYADNTKEIFTEQEYFQLLNIL